MSRKETDTNARISDEVLTLWKELEPVEGYAAGYATCKGKLAPADAATLSELLCRAEDLKRRCQALSGEGTQASAYAILESITGTAGYDRPDSAVGSCFLAFWYTILKHEENEPFVPDLLEKAAELVEQEHERWSGQDFSGEVRKSGFDICNALRAILVVLAKNRPSLALATARLADRTEQYQKAFDFPSQVTGNLDALLRFFRSNPGAAGDPVKYAQMVERQVGYGATVEEIYRQSLAMLDSELAATNEVADRLVAMTGELVGKSLGAKYSWLCRRYRINDGIAAKAGKVVEVLNRFVHQYLQGLGKLPEFKPETTPAFLRPFVTSGATIVLNYATATPVIHIYVTEDKTTSWLSLLNILVHEVTHAYLPLILAADSATPELAKLKTWLAVPLLEATAFHREWELFETVHDEWRSSQELSPLQEELLTLIDTPPYPLEQDVAALEFESRYWRVIRALRSICDVEVNSGKKRYPEFVEWAHQKTGLGKRLIHDECFVFLALPGYTPSYSYCGSQYASLQKAAAARGLSRFDFNTRASKMGFLPWTECVAQMEKFEPRSFNAP